MFIVRTSMVNKYMSFSEKGREDMSRQVPECLRIHCCPMTRLLTACSGSARGQSRLPWYLEVSGSKHARIIDKCIKNIMEIVSILRCTLQHLEPYYGAVEALLHVHESYLE